MPRPLSPADAKGMAYELMPSFLRQRKKALAMDSWYHTSERDLAGELYVPEDQDVNKEYKTLASASPTPFIALGIKSMVQLCYLDGIRRAGTTTMLDAWSSWQENGWDSKQTPLYRAVLMHGLAYTRVLPGRNPITGVPTAKWKSFSAKTMAAFYSDDDDDEFPMSALEAKPYEVRTTNDAYETGYNVTLYDENYLYRLSCKDEGLELKDWTFITYDSHDLGFVPIVEYANEVHIDGRTRGEIEPFIPLARRIDQDTFDRLIVQRYGAWKVRYVTGMVKPPEVSDEEYQANLIKLKINDFLVGDNKDMRFGTLDETQLDGFIKARDADVRDLSAVMQVPPDHMLGLSSNLQAEALQTAREGLRNKTFQQHTSWAESHERKFRVTAHIQGNRAEAQAFDMQCHWRNMSPLPLSQAADALSKLADKVHVPTTMLWEMIPYWTDTDVERAKQLLQEGAIETLIGLLEQQSLVGSGDNAAS